MLRRLALLALLACFATPVLAAELEFMPGTSPEQKFAWAQQNYRTHCPAAPNAIYRDFQSKKLSDFLPVVRSELEKKNKQQVINFIRQDICGNEEAVFAAYVISR